MSVEQYYEPFKLSRMTPGTGPADEPTLTSLGFFTGFIQPIGGSEINRFAKVGERYTHRCYCPIDTPAEYGDEIERDGEKWTVTYSVQDGGISRVRHHKELLLEAT